jgi:hypothetical protein
MAETRPAKKGASVKKRASGGFSDDERAAMRERAKELKTAARRGSRVDRADGEGDVLEKIAEMPQPDRAMAERLHALIEDTAPDLWPTSQRPRSATRPCNTASRKARRAASRASTRCCGSSPERGVRSRARVASRLYRDS